MPYLVAHMRTSTIKHTQPILPQIRSFAPHGCAATVSSRCPMAYELCWSATPRQTKQLAAATSQQ
eukprot:scaffold194799_cov16-Tisochrysis_lutea.AAC.1